MYSQAPHKLDLNQWSQREKINKKIAGFGWIHHNHIMAKFVLQPLGSTTDSPLFQRRRLHNESLAAQNSDNKTNGWVMNIDLLFSHCLFLSHIHTYICKKVNKQNNVILLRPTPTNNSLIINLLIGVGYLNGTFTLSQHRATFLFREP